MPDNFGHFTENAREYVITEPFAPPRYQINFMWNDVMVSGVNQFGTGEGVFNNQTMLYNCPEGRVRMIRDGRRYFYLQDRESGEFWNTGLYPKKHPKGKLATRVGLGYSVFTCEADGIKSESTVMLAPDEPVEIWSFSISNNSGKARKLSLVPYVEWMIGGYATFSSPYSYLRSTVDFDNKAVVSYNTSDERPHGRYNAFLASDISFTKWCGSNRDFLGPFGTTSTPASLLSQDMSCKESWCEELAGAMYLDFELQDGESRELSVILGSFDTEEEKARLIAKTIAPAYRKAALENLEKKSDELLGSVNIQTPNEQINRLVNVWAKQQIKLCAEFGRDGARGFRDTLQDAWGITPFDAKLTAEKIIETISHQHSDGHGIRGWMPLQPHHYSDGPTWITPTVAAYLKETGDYGFLERKAPYLDEGEGTVLDHMLCGVRHLSEDLGAHGLVLAHEGDWNDSLNWMGRGGKGESVWTSMALYYSLNCMKELAGEILKDNALVTEMEERAQKILDAIETHGWDGKWYLAGYSDAGRKVGSEENEEGKIYLNPQTWAIMTGIAKGDRYEKCVAAIDNILESKHGSLTLTPVYTKEDLHVGRVTVLLPGMYENCTPYCHGTAFKIMADCCASRGDEALRSFLKVMPDNPDHPSLVSGCEPYAFTNQYLGPDNGRAGASISGWISGTAGWMFRAVLEYFAGIQPGYNGFYVKPCLPSSWDNIKATRVLRGKKYDIVIDRAGSSLTITVNGEAVKDGYVSY
ncbi:MAG: hypothetical protein JXR97_05330 [Planctomycetes bacterium]|nr:hypothetical protein [Planctomycetota bacterium]